MASSQMKGLKGKDFYGDPKWRHPTTGCDCNTSFLPLLYPTTITTAAEILYDDVHYYIDHIETYEDKKVAEFSIRKTFIRETIDPEDIGILNLDKYLKKHYNYQSMDGLIPIAVVDYGALHQQIIRDGYMDDAEDYALQLRNRVIKMFDDDDDERIRVTTRSGRKDGGKSEGYILYMTYKFH